MENNFSSVVDNSWLDQTYSFDNDSLDLDIGLLHDNYSQLICDSITIWRNSNSLMEDKILVVWNTINSELAATLGVSQDAISLIFNEMDIDSTNWTTIHNDKYPLLPKEYQIFIDDIEQVYIENHEESDEEIILAFEAKKTHWQTILNPVIVQNTIDVAKSSYIFWHNNFESCLMNGEVTYRETRWKAIGKLALGDVTGGLWGSFGGPGGALLGAVGGTLGATISGAIFGYD
jgi:hypothetical protein